MLQDIRPVVLVPISTPVSSTPVRIFKIVALFAVAALLVLASNNVGMPGNLGTAATFYRR